MKTTEQADEYLRSVACRKHLIDSLKRVEDVATFSRINRGEDGWYLEIDRYRAWLRVQVGWIHDDTADFMVEATAYYRKIDDGEVFAVTDLGDGLREFRVATGYWSLSQFVDGQLLGSFIHRRVNQGTTEDLPLIDFTDSMVQTRRNADANMLPAAICRVMLGSMRLAKFRA
jgi:hypothetical protein